MNIISNYADLISALRLISISKKPNHNGVPDVHVELTPKNIKVSRNLTHFEIELNEAGQVQFNILTRSSKDFNTLAKDASSPIRACLTEIYYKISTGFSKVDLELLDILNRFFKEPEIDSAQMIHYGRERTIQNMKNDLPDTLLFRLENGVTATIDYVNDSLSISAGENQSHCLVENTESYFSQTNFIYEHRYTLILAVVVGLVGHDIRAQNNLMLESGVLLEAFKTLNPSSNYQNEWF